MMKKQHKQLVTIVLYGLLMLSLQSCFGNSDFSSTTNGQNGAIGVNQTQQATFKGKIFSNIIDNNANDANFDPNVQANENTALQPYNKSTSLLTDQYLSYPIWSPDGSQIIYYDYSGTTFNLSLATIVKNSKSGAYSIKAGSQIVLVNSQGDINTDSHPAWSAA